MDKTKAILLLDENSKKMIKTNIADFSLYNILFVNNLGEISASILQETKTVVVLEGFLRNGTGLSDLRLFKALEQLNYVIIGQDETLLEQAKSVGSIFQADITTLKHEIIEAALYNDMTLQEVPEDNVRNATVEFAKLILKNEADYDTKYVKLANEFLATANCISDLSRELKSEKKKNITLQANNVKVHTENEMLTTSYANMMKSAYEMNKSLKEYEHILTKDVYEKLKLHHYPNRPQIIYLKEYEELNYLHSLIYTLYEVFRIQGKQSVKVLQLFDSSNSRRLKVLPAYFKILENGYLLKDVIANDFICKIGDYRGVLEALLTNRANLDILIIVDCKCYNDTVLSGSYLQFNMCRNVKHLENYELISANTIVNNCPGDEYLSWDYVPQYDEFADNETRFLYLSSQPLITKVVELSQIFWESMQEVINESY